MTLISDSENTFDLATLAAFLGAGFSAGPSPHALDAEDRYKGRGVIITPNGAVLTVALGTWKERGRLVVSWYPSKEQNARFERAGGKSLHNENYNRVPDITVSVKATVARVAREIQRRILPAVMVAHDNVETLIMDRFNATIDSRALASAIASALGVTFTPNAEKQYAPREADEVVGGFGLRFAVSSNGGKVRSVDFDYGVCREDREGLALAIARAARDYFAAKDMPDLADPEEAPATLAAE